MRAMQIVLAPMEGLADYRMRQLLTEVGGYDWCVSEFIRVSGTLLPERVFYRWCPELQQGARTQSGTPVHVQLLGSDPGCMAANAERAVALGAQAIDLNFGCPAKTVNRHGGGAVLLDCPEAVHQVVLAVRRALSPAIPVSAKMRLGNLDASRAVDNACAIAEAGASWLTVHGRTKAQGYRPPAWWDQIGRIVEAVTLPVIANGEVWSLADARACLAQSGCQALMLGRGAVSDPFLAQRLRGDCIADGAADRGAGDAASVHDWSALQRLLVAYVSDLQGSGTDRQVCGRIKQWLYYLRRNWPQVAACYAELVRFNDPLRMLAQIVRLAPAPPGCDRQLWPGTAPDQRAETADLTEPAAALWRRQNWPSA